MIRRIPRTPSAPRTRLGRLLRRFRLSEAGNSSIEFVLLFPAIWMMFGATMEAGMYSMQQVMLERGLDLTVRDVRLGIIPAPTHEKLVKATCKYAVILIDCETNMRLEMLKSTPTAFVAPSPTVPCIDKVQTGIANVAISNGANNDLMVLRVCVQIEPLLPLAAMGRELIKGGKPGHYPLSATSSYVMEPFQWS
ncbi:TadE/TadG family type IV pilus assembly protein [Loktanella sp. DJP18]|uniref:TadE/TadG family type IV pilus assembly protein n=1 Tax=Loktanella sp. DJP18 TaxID=3409788 RepID=UPI003BB7647D